MATATAAGAADRPIKRQDLVGMFDGMRADAPWNVDGPLLWGYFFLSSDLPKLQAASETLKADGYRIVQLRADRSGPKPKWQLHVERVETHTVESLLERNEQFYRLAERFGLESYDGMDVGPAP
ncbi:MAG: ribonuclease E inhibitor RraB [Caulobacteraceae bacterium]|nr:MAG: ribonuclease E inhibitor RraB [Caulobacteraceae bacterium]